MSAPSREKERSTHPRHGRRVLSRATSRHLAPPRATSRHLGCVGGGGAGGRSRAVHPLVEAPRLVDGRVHRVQLREHLQVSRSAGGRRTHLCISPAPRAPATRSRWHARAKTCTPRPPRCRAWVGSLMIETTHARTLLSAPSRRSPGSLPRRASSCPAAIASARPATASSASSHLDTPPRRRISSLVVAGLGGGRAPLTGRASNGCLEKVEVRLASVWQASETCRLEGA